MLAEDRSATIYRVIHPSADVEPGSTIAPGVRIWHCSRVRAGASIGPETQLGSYVYVDAGVVIGARCAIQNCALIYRGVTLEDDVFVGPSVVFTNDRYPRAHHAGWKLVPTFVRRGASLGANSTIIAGVTVGEWAMIAAGSVVTRDVEAHRMVMGSPARARGWACRCGRPVRARPVGECGHADPGGGW